MGTHVKFSGRPLLPTGSTHGSVHTEGSPGHPTSLCMKPILLLHSEEPLLLANHSGWPSVFNLSPRLPCSPTATWPACSCPPSQSSRLPSCVQQVQRGRGLPCWARPLPALQKSSSLEKLGGHSLKWLSFISPMSSTL